MRIPTCLSPSHMLCSAETWFQPLVYSQRTSQPTLLRPCLHDSQFAIRDSNKADLVFVCGDEKATRPSNCRFRSGSISVPRRRALGATGQDSQLELTELSLTYQTVWVARAFRTPSLATYNRLPICGVRVREASFKRHLACSQTRPAVSWISM